MAVAAAKASNQRCGMWWPAPGAPMRPACAATPHHHPRGAEHDNADAGKQYDELVCPADVVAHVQLHAHLDCLGNGTVVVKAGADQQRALLVEVVSDLPLRLVRGGGDHQRTALRAGQEHLQWIGRAGGANVGDRALKAGVGPVACSAWRCSAVGEMVRMRRVRARCSGRHRGMLQRPRDVVELGSDGRRGRCNVTAIDRRIAGVDHLGAAAYPRTPGRGPGQAGEDQEEHQQADPRSCGGLQRLPKRASLGTRSRHQAMPPRVSLTAWPTQIEATQVEQVDRTGDGQHQQKRRDEQPGVKVPTPKQPVPVSPRNIGKLEVRRAGRDLRGHVRTASARSARCCGEHRGRCGWTDNRNTCRTARR